MANQTVSWNDRSIRALKPSKSRYVAWSKAENGLGIRVAPSGRKSFVYMYRYQGTPRMMTLGQYQAVGDLANCNKSHAEAEKKLAKGQDPGALLVQKKKEHRDSDSFAELTVKFLAFKRAKKGSRERTWREVERIFDKYVNTKIGKKKAREVTRVDIGKVLSTLESEGKLTQARRVLSWIRTALKYGLSRGMLDSDPSAGLSLGTGESRDRVLSEEEIRGLWDAELEMNRQTQLALMLLIVTGQRAENVLYAQWSEIEGSWWTIPKERFKGKRTHRVPLTPRALELLKEIRNLSEDSDHLFPSPRGDKPMEASSLAHAVSRNAEALQKELDPWIPRDIRRTVATGLGNLEFDDDQIRYLILGHSRGKLSQTYNHAKYDNPKRQMLTAWDTDLGRILRGEPREENKAQPAGNVVEMRK